MMPVENNRAEFRQSRVSLIAELAIALAGLAFGYAGLIPLGATPVLVVLGGLSLWLRGDGLKRVGLGTQQGWSRAALLGLVAGVGYQFLSLYVVEPLIACFTGELPNVSIFAPLIGNTRFLLISLAVSWTLAAFGEEFVYRGYLLNRVAQFAGETRAAWLFALILTSVLFGLGHLYQGTSGVATVALNGFVYGVLYLASGRSLWAPIVAHGTSDTVGFLLIFLGSYPGM